ncbi:hypothetical protein MBLNU230_g0884t1 [Neophaeotheca triangularis]
MDINIAKALQDKLYDKRKAGALELESSIRVALSEGNHQKIAKTVNQLCQDFAYAVHQPHARNGGLIGLAAAAIALGPEVARYLPEIVPPVLACFSDQDARVRYYACESMYNMAKVAKGEILLYFNNVFDALCKLAADTELSVKNGAELLDRLVKDIVSESAATYASILLPEPENAASDEHSPHESVEATTAFSLPRFIPLLQERINVLNPFTRTFLVSWITLLDSIPDLELVAYLPSFFGGLLKFLSDPNQDVHTTTKVALDRFLVEIKKIAAVKKGIAESKKSKEGAARTGSTSSKAVVVDSPRGDQTEIVAPEPEVPQAAESEETLEQENDEGELGDDGSSITAGDEDKDVDSMEDEWIPGQDVQIDYRSLLDILVTFLSNSREEEIQITTLKWIESFFDICPEAILSFTPRLLAQVLPALSHDVDHVKQAASRVNQALTAYIVSLPEEPSRASSPLDERQQSSNTAPSSSAAGVRDVRNTNGLERRESAQTTRTARKPMSPEPVEQAPRTPEIRTPEPPATEDERPKPHGDLDYEAAVSALTLQFLHEHEATRVAAIAWLIMLHRKSPRKILATHDGTFPALLKTLSDPAESVVTRDLLLLSQISKNSDDGYFSSFMINLLQLFCTDRRLLETRGNLIIRQLCMSLPAERIYRTMADCLEGDEDIEFASIMVQNLNNNLITAPELQDLRKRLRNLDSRDGQTFFTVLFRAWCVNAVATFSLCLLAQAYEQAYNLLQIFAELEMTVNMLIQIDKLVQLLESPVFTYLRMQLLEPERYPHLYKCLYGLLMLLPQSSAFAALKNRLNSVSAIGYLHIPTRGPSGPTTPSTVSTFERQNRLKSRDDSTIKWTELLEKFKATQERVRRVQQRNLGAQHGLHASESQQRDSGPVESSGLVGREMGKGVKLPERPGGAAAGGSGSRSESAQGFGRVGGVVGQVGQGIVQGHQKGKSSLSHLGRFAGGVRGNGKAKK